VDLEKAKSNLEKRTIIKGVVKELREYNIDGTLYRDLIVLCKKENFGAMIIIPHDEIENFSFSNTPKSLVGEIIKFCITEIDEDTNTIFGSMKVAKEKAQSATRKRMYKGEVLMGTIVTFTDYGAYIDVGNGIQGFLRNRDFSPYGTPIKSVYPKWAEIKVKYKDTSSSGTILFEAVDKYLKNRDGEDFVRNGTYAGAISDIKNNKVFVRLSADKDCLCPYPESMGFLKKGENVNVRVLKSGIDEKTGVYRLRGIILSKVEEVVDYGIYIE
jgi:hypothetical protein